MGIPAELGMTGDGGGRYGLVRIGMQRSVMTWKIESRSPALIFYLFAGFY